MSHEILAATQQLQTAPALKNGEVSDVDQPIKEDLYAESLQRLHLQRKLSVGAADDPLEDEADAMADRVMRMSEKSFIQRKCNHCEHEEDEQIQRAILPAQTKLTVGSVNDPLEDEADAMADQVMRMPEESFIQRKCKHCEEEDEKEVQRMPLVSFIRKKEDTGGSAVSNDVSNQILSTRGGGNAMPEASKSFMESRFGADFSSVKIHTGNYASQLSSQLDARAFTVGNDIYFNEGRYQPHSTEGKHLLAHELTHTVQQGASSVNAKRIQRNGEGDIADPRETVVTYKPGKKNPVKEGRISFEYRAEKQLPFAQINILNHPLMIWAVQHVFNISEDVAADIVSQDNLVWSTTSGRTVDFNAGQLVKFTLPIGTIGKWIGILSARGLVDPQAGELFEQMMELQQNLSDRDYSFFLEWVKEQGIGVTNITDFQNLTPESLKKFKALYHEFIANKYKLLSKPKEYFLTADVTRDMRFEDLKDRFFNKEYSRLTDEEKGMIKALFQDKVLSTAFIALEESKIISKQETEKYKEHPELLTEVAQLVSGYSPGFISNIEARLAEFGKFNTAYYEVIQAAPTMLHSPQANSAYSEIQKYYYTYEQVKHDISPFFAMYSNRKSEILSYFSANNFENALAAELANTLSVYAWSSKDNLRRQYLPEEIDSPLFKQFKQKFPNPGSQFGFETLKNACVQIILSSYPDIEKINSSDQDALSEMRLLGLNKKHKILSDISIDFRKMATKDIASIKGSILDELGSKPDKAEKTQSRLIRDTDLVWEFQPLLYHVLQQEHIDSKHPIYKVIDAKIKSVADKSFWESLALGALALVLGLAGIFTGGTTTALGFALLAGSATVGIIDLSHQYAEYSIQSDAHAAAFAVPFAEDPSSIGLWLSLIGVVLDIKGLMEVFDQTAKVAGKLAKTGSEAGGAADEAIKRLAKTNNIDEYAEQMYEILNGKKILRPGITKEAFIKSVKESWYDSHALIESWKKYETVIEKLPAALKASIESSGLLKLPVELRSGLFKIHDFDPEAFNKLITAVAHNPEQLQILSLQVFRNRTMAEVYGQLSQVLERNHFEQAIHYFAGVGHASADALPELLHIMNKGNIFSKGDLALQVLTNRKLQQLTLNLSANPGEMLKLWENFAVHGGGTSDDFVKFVEKNSPYSGLTKLEESSAPVAKVHGPETNKGVLTDIHGRPPSTKALEGLGEDMEKLGKSVDNPANIREVKDPSFQAKYDAEVEVDNHTFRRDRETGKWCRFSDEVCNVDAAEKINAKVEEALGNPENIQPGSVEDITTKIDPGDVSDTAPKPGAAGSEEHRAQRWKEYEERMKDNPKKWKPQRWNNVYDKNIKRAKNANKAVDAYKAREGGWLTDAEREVRVEIEGVERRFDIMETKNIPPELRPEGIMHLDDLEKAGIKPKVVEHKTGKIYNTMDIQWEVARDEILVKEKGWLIEWVFEGSASGPLKEALTKAQIPYKEIPVL